MKQNVKLCSLIDPVILLLQVYMFLLHFSLLDQLSFFPKVNSAQNQLAFKVYIINFSFHTDLDFDFNSHVYLNYSNILVYDILNNIYVKR